MDAAVITEPTELTLVPVQAGSVCFRLELEGRPAHACVRDEGVSAVEKFYLLLRGMQRLEAVRNARDGHELLAPYRNRVPINVGVVRAGTWPSTVPDKLVAEGRVGVWPEEPVESAQREFEACLAEVSAGDPWLRVHPPRVLWTDVFESAVLDTGHPLFGVLDRAVVAVTGHRPPVKGVTYGSDMRLFVRVGQTPALLFGPGDVRKAHAVDEYVEWREVETAATVLAVALTEWCGVAC